MALHSFNITALRLTRYESHCVSYLIVRKFRGFRDCKKNHEIKASRIKILAKLNTMVRNLNHKNLDKQDQQQDVQLMYQTNSCNLAR